MELDPKFGHNTALIPLLWAMIPYELIVTRLDGFNVILLYVFTLRICRPTNTVCLPESKSSHLELLTSVSEENLHTQLLHS